MRRIADLHAGEAKTDARDADSNRITGIQTQIYPALERVLGPRLDRPAVLDLLQRYPSPLTTPSNHPRLQLLKLIY